MIPEGAIVSGFISKVINDLVDVSKDKIKKADSDRKIENQSFETRVYQVIIDAINEFTSGTYSNQDVLYDAAEKMLNGFKNGEKNNIAAVKFGLSGFITNVDDIECERFIRVLCHEISNENNFDVYKEIVLMYQGQEIEFNHDILQRMDKKIDHLSEDIAEKNKNFKGNDNLQNSNIKQKVKSRTQEYLDKWNANMFLNDFDKRDENAGVNVKLSEVYLEEQLPHYIWGDNINVLYDLKDLLSEYIYLEKRKMLLILGQPGIGKSTLITWIITNFKNMKDDILVYQFASDLKNIDICDLDKVTRKVILGELILSLDDLEGKILILDGFDEINLRKDRAVILNLLNKYFFEESLLKNFSLIVTCRENYIENIRRLECNYITLQSWESNQIQSFCKVYSKKAKCSISDDTVDNILKDKEVLGIPLILYMVLALDISVEKEGSIVDVYDQIFSLEEGGIYERCFINIKKNKMEKYAAPHWSYALKRQIHQISRNISIWMFENKPEEAYIPQEVYEKICIDVSQNSEQNAEHIEKNVLVGSYFKLVRHTEGTNTEKLSFVHRSIYEYFVVETIYNAVIKPIERINDENHEELAEDFVFYLKEGDITYTIGEFLLHKISKLYSKLDNDKKQKFYQWWESAVYKMMKAGMFYYTKRNIEDYKKIMDKESKCFLNIIKILRLLLCFTNNKYIMESINRNELAKWIKYCLISNENCDFSCICLCQANFHGAYLKKIILCQANLKQVYMSNAYLNEANLKQADLSKAFLVKASLKQANLMEANLMEAVLFRADLKQANLIKSNMIRADLRTANLCCADLKDATLIGADLGEINLEGADIRGTIFDEGQIDNLKEQHYCLQDVKVYIARTGDIISYKDYCKSKQ